MLKIQFIACKIRNIFIFRSYFQATFEYKNELIENEFRAVYFGTL